MIFNDSGASDVPLPNEAGMRRDLPQRRSVRLPGYDYSQAGWYFVTIMAHDGAKIFGRVTPDAELTYTSLGEVVCQCWHEVSARYPQMHPDAWVLMPNHMHLLIGLLPATGQVSAKPLGQIVAAFKATTTRLARPLRTSTGSLWQRSYHEHIIRNASELNVYRAYVRDNPRRWLEKKTPIQLST